MSVIIEYRGKWLEWCVCTIQGEILIDFCETEEGARRWAMRSGWKVLV